MANLKDVRLRIASVSSTQQITSAMKMVSAAKLRKAQNAILKMRPYENKLAEIFQNASANLEIESPYLVKRDKKEVLFVIVASNKGLCSSFNSNIIKEGVAQIKRLQEKEPNVKISLICIGKRASDFFKKAQYNVIESYDHLLDNLAFESIVGLADELMAKFEKKKYDNVTVIYNKFKNAATQILSTEQWLPMPIDDNPSVPVYHQAEYLLQPDKNVLSLNLIPFLLKIRFYKFLLDSSASEHGARMVAMQTATDNATTLIKELKLSYNKARQMGITNELIEIVSGANALNG